MRKTNIAFIGAGHLASHLIKGLIQADYGAEHIWVSNPHYDKLKTLQERYGIHIEQNNHAVVEHADMVILTVRPNKVAIVLHDMAKTLQRRRPIMISAASGITLASLQSWLGSDYAVARCMPNLACALNYGVTGLLASPSLTDQQKQQIASIFETLGSSLWLKDDEQIDTITALSGSGIAIFFLIIEHLAQAAIDCGLDKTQAYQVSVHTALGASQLASQSPQTLAQLREQVTVPGGTTEQALKILQQGSLQTLLKNAVLAAKKQAQHIRDTLSEASP